MMILTKRFCDPPNLSPIGFCGAKSGYLCCESMVFDVQKCGICSAKVWFLRCESMVFVVQKYGYFVGIRVYIAICSQRCCNPSAAVGSDLSRPHIRKRPRNGGGKCACGDVNIRIR